MDSVAAEYPFGFMLQCACVYMCVSPRSRPQSFHPLPSCKLWSDIWMLHRLFFHRCVLIYWNLCWKCLWDVLYNLAVVFFDLRWPEVTEPSWPHLRSTNTGRQNGGKDHRLTISSHTAQTRASPTMLDAFVLQWVTSAYNTIQLGLNSVFTILSFNAIQLHKIASLCSYYGTLPLFQIERFHSHTYPFSSPVFHPSHPISVVCSNWRITPGSPQSPHSLQQNSAEGELGV